MPDTLSRDVERLADAIHEARCGPVPDGWGGDTAPVPWKVSHREWDIATAKALRLLGVAHIDALTAAVRALPYVAAGGKSVNRAAVLAILEPHDA